MDAIRHFELGAEDRSALGKFYADLFGWHVEEFPEMQYVTIDTHAGKGINGGIGPGDGGWSRSTIYAEVADLQATLDKAVALGGTVMMDIMEVPGVVTLAMFGDPQGNAIGIIKRADGDENGVSEGTNPGVTWFEIAAPDPAALSEFYTELFGWSFHTGEAQYNQGDGEAPPYFQFSGDERIGGGIGPAQDGKPRVTSYAEVEDLQAFLDKAEGLGASTVVPPTDVGEVSFAQFTDPAGIVFGLYKMNS